MLSPSRPNSAISLALWTADCRRRMRLRARARTRPNGDLWGAFAMGVARRVADANVPRPARGLGFAHAHAGRVQCAGAQAIQMTFVALDHHDLIRVIMPQPGRESPICGVEGECERWGSLPRRGRETQLRGCPQMLQCNWSWIRERSASMHKSTGKALGYLYCGSRVCAGL